MNKITPNTHTKNTTRIETFEIDLNELLKVNTTEDNEETTRKVTLTDEVMNTGEVYKRSEGRQDILPKITFSVTTVTKVKE